MPNKQMRQIDGIKIFNRLICFCSFLLCKFSAMETNSATRLMLRSPKSGLKLKSIASYLIPLHLYKEFRRGVHF